MMLSRRCLVCPAVPLILLFLIGCRSPTTTGLNTSAEPGGPDVLSDQRSCMTRDLPAFPRIQRLAVSAPENVTDTLILTLSKDNRFRLVERARLKSVLDEQQLNASGMTDGEQAVKLGSLLPLDLLIVAREDNGRIQGRFLDVVNGEILSAFACKSGMDGRPDPGNTTIPTNQTITNSNNTNSTINSTTNSNNTNITTSSTSNTNIHIDNLVVSNVSEIVARRCDSVHRPVQDRFANLNGQDHLDAAVAAAVRVPFDLDCGRIHFDIMDTFRRYHIFPSAYTRFLIRTLNGLDQPSNDSRATSIVSYFAESNGGIEPEEWQSGLSLLERAQEGTAAQVITRLINLKRELAPVEMRAETILALAESGRIGRPVVFHPAVVFKQIVQALRFDRQDRAAPALAFLQKHAEQYAKHPDRPGTYTSTVKTLMNESLSLTVSADRRMLYSIIAQFYAFPEAPNPARDDKYFHDQLFYDLVYPIQKQKKELQNEAERQTLEADEAFMTATLRPHLCHTPELWPPQGYSRNEMVSYLLLNGVACPNLPTVADLTRQLNEGDWPAKVEATDFLRKMGANAAPAEASALKYYLIQGMSRSNEIRSNCAEILGNVKTKNPAAIRALIDGLGDFDSTVQGQSEKAVQKLGATAVPYLIDVLNRTQGNAREINRRLRCVEILGRLGAIARPALPLLQRIATTDIDSYVRSRANVAAVNIQEGRAE